MLSAFLLQANTTTAAGAVGGPLTAYWPVMIFLAVAAVFPVLPVVLGRFVRPNLYGKAKMRPYECGIDPITEAHDRFTVRYYIVAMLFLVFDVEALFFYPWAVLVRELRWNGILAIAGFFAVLGVGYLYARARGALKWR